jgi:hypothetical protein
VLSLNWNVETPIRAPYISSNWHSFGRASHSKQGIAQPTGVILSNVQRVAKHAGLVPTSRMRWVEAIVFELSKIEANLFGVG